MKITTFKDRETETERERGGISTLALRSVSVSDYHAFRSLTEVL